MLFFALHNAFCLEFCIAWNCHLCLKLILLSFYLHLQTNINFGPFLIFKIQCLFDSHKQYIGICYNLIREFSSVHLLSCVWLFHHMNCSTPGFPVHHQLLELAQTHVHQVSDAIQPSHPLSSPSLPALNLSQYQGLFQWQFFASGGQSIGASASASGLPMNIQDWFPLGLIGLILQFKGLSRVSSNTTVHISILVRSYNNFSLFL